MTAYKQNNQPILADPTTVDKESSINNIIQEFNCRLESNVCAYVLLKIVGNSVWSVQICFISNDILRS